MKENDPWELTPEIIKEIEQHKKEMKELKRQRVESLNRLGEVLDSTLVGIWGQLTGAGVRMYGVYSKNATESFHFIVIGKSEEVIIADSLEERNAIAASSSWAAWRGEESKVKYVLTKDEEPTELNGYIVKKFNPEKTPNGHPVNSVDKFLNEDY